MQKLKQKISLKLMHSGFQNLTNLLFKKKQSVDFV